MSQERPQPPIEIEKEKKLQIPDWLQDTEIPQGGQYDRDHQAQTTTTKEKLLHEMDLSKEDMARYIQVLRELHQAIYGRTGRMTDGDQAVISMYRALHAAHHERNHIDVDSLLRRDPFSMLEKYGERTTLRARHLAELTPVAFDDVSQTAYASAKIKARWMETLPRKWLPKVARIMKAMGLDCVYSPDQHKRADSEAAIAMVPIILQRANEIIALCKQYPLLASETPSSQSSAEHRPITVAEAYEVCEKLGLYPLTQSDPLQGKDSLLENGYPILAQIDQLIDSGWTLLTEAEWSESGNFDGFYYREYHEPVTIPPATKWEFSAPEFLPIDSAPEAPPAQENDFLSEQQSQLEQGEQSPMSFLTQLLRRVKLKYSKLKPPSNESR